MPRTLTTSFRRQINAYLSGDVVLLFAEITHPNLATPIRVVTDTVDYTWNGNTWTGVMFDVQLLTDNDSVPETRVTIPNVDTAFGNALLALVNPPSVKLWVLTSADFNLTVDPRAPLGVPDIEYYAEGLFLTDVVVDALQVSGRLSTYDLAREYAFKQRTTKDRAPGCWR